MERYIRSAANAPGVPIGRSEKHKGSSTCPNPVGHDSYEGSGKGLTSSQGEATSRLHQLLSFPCNFVPSLTFPAPRSHFSFKTPLTNDKLPCTCMFVCNTPFCLPTTPLTEKFLKKFFKALKIVRVRGRCQFSYVY